MSIASRILLLTGLSLAAFGVRSADRVVWGAPVSCTDNPNPRLVVCRVPILSIDFPGIGMDSWARDIELGWDIPAGVRRYAFIINPVNSDGSNGFANGSLSAHVPVTDPILTFKDVMGYPPLPTPHEKYVNTTPYDPACSVTFTHQDKIMGNNLGVIYSQSCAVPVACTLSLPSGNTIDFGVVTASPLGNTPIRTIPLSVGCPGATAITVGIAASGDLPTNHPAVKNRISIDGQNYSRTYNGDQISNIAVGSTLMWAAGTSPTGSINSSVTIVVTVH